MLSGSFGCRWLYLSQIQGLGYKILTVKKISYMKDFNFVLKVVFYYHPLGILKIFFIWIKSVEQMLFCLWPWIVWRELLSISEIMAKFHSCVNSRGFKRKYTVEYIFKKTGTSALQAAALKGALARRNKLNALHTVIKGIIARTLTVLPALHQQQNH